MKIWSSNHVFSHPWETVVQAASRKYPNPLTTNVSGVDVIDRQLNKETGALSSHRLISTKWGFPNWVVKLVGIEESCYVSEHSTINPREKTMQLTSRNVTFSSVVCIHEELNYVPDPEDPKNKTLLKQEATITVNGVPMTSYCENMIKSSMNGNVAKGRQAMEWVINHIKEETQGVRNVFSSSNSL